MAERGEIRNRKYAQQIQDFTGLRWGAITPTNLDCFVEFGAQLFCFAEGKHDDAPLSRGQKMAFERLCQCCHRPEEKCWAILFKVAHYGDGDIDYANCPVTEYFWEGQWRCPKKTLNLRRAIDRMREWVKIHSEEPL